MRLLELSRPFLSDIVEWLMKRPLREGYRALSIRFAVELRYEPGHRETLMTDD